MIQPYNRLNGVPSGHWYLVHILAFGDFEVRQEEMILFTSKDKDDLLRYCQSNSISLTDARTEYYIAQKEKA